METHVQKWGNSLALRIPNLWLTRLDCGRIRPSSCGCVTIRW